jgi:hypothetical protein
MSEEVLVPINTMNPEAAARIVEGGNLAMNLLNYLELHPDRLLSIYPDRDKFADMAAREGSTVEQIEQEFMSQQRRILMIVTFLFKDVLAEVARYYNLPYIEDKTVEHNLMSMDMDEADDDGLNQADIMEEIDQLLRREN